MAKKSNGKTTKKKQSSKKTPVKTISSSAAKKIARDKGDLMIEVFATRKSESTAATQHKKCKAEHGERALPIIDDDGEFVVAYLAEKSNASSDQNVPRVDGGALAENARANRRAEADKGDKKPTKKEKTSNKKKAGADKAKTAKQPGGLDYAAQVLAKAKEPLNAKTIAERAIAAGWKTEGATPHATLYSAMIREIEKKGSESRFEKVDRGLFRARKGA